MKNGSIFPAHLKLVYEFGKDTKEGLGICGFAVFSKVGGSLAEFFHGSLLERLQRLDCRMTVFQEILNTTELRHKKMFNLIYYIVFSLSPDPSEGVLRIHS